MFGSYNVCIPVWVNPPSVNRVLIRIPLPYKIGEATNPGNVDEKLRCEAATYIGFVKIAPAYLSRYFTGSPFLMDKLLLQFIEPSSAPLLTRICWRVNHTVRSWLGLPTSCPYISLRRRGAWRTGYMIIGFVERGRMLSDSWAVMLQDTARRQTLFSDLAKIILSLNRVQLPRAGSLTMSNEGVITLTNRPLTLRLQPLENEGIATIPRDSTYESVEPYLLDLLQCHDNRICYQPNAIHDVKDGQEQLAALTMMRGLLQQFVSRQHRHGPFFMTLTDLHPSSIFVDDDWHITSLIDLEWACAFPLELQTPHYWLTGRPIDDIEHGEHLQMFEEVVMEYIDAFKRQEMTRGSPISHAQVLRECWDRGSFWYFQAVHSPKGLLRVFNEHIQRRFCEEHCTQSIFDRTVSPYWCVDAKGIIEKKVEEEKDYKNRLKVRFAS
ncbi:hypothetical protein ASPBRDRAFT_198212 [Aspergillus brasiliensis CBS 101740]|uniref:Aminoglycoside phosphotransferase domain-containing protein n=1 Tax=Aspergillus brasiliensis (strain CBS 101740 / IMI 381727 / IBT 21946) TaxID=767769 RepID=A0A1L9UD12_ASPBC|nr:hypothetical protein ASPBRDRAFT_198212 [Aspergillus brasiliensis CBS 101740]